MSDAPSGISRRGFASMNPERLKIIAAKGGASVPADKRSFSRDHTLAVDMGRKGGQKSRRKPLTDAGDKV